MLSGDLLYLLSKQLFGSDLFNFLLLNRFTAKLTALPYFWKERENLLLEKYPMLLSSADNLDLRSRVIFAERQLLRRRKYGDKWIYFACMNILNKAEADYLQDGDTCQRDYYIESRTYQIFQADSEEKLVERISQQLSESKSSFKKWMVNFPSLIYLFYKCILPFLFKEEETFAIILTAASTGNFLIFERVFSPKLCISSMIPYRIIGGNNLQIYELFEKEIGFAFEESATLIREKFANLEFFPKEPLLSRLLEGKHKASEDSEFTLEYLKVYASAYRGELESLKNLEKKYLFRFLEGLLGAERYEAFNFVLENVVDVKFLEFLRFYSHHFSRIYTKLTRMNCLNLNRMFCKMGVFGWIDPYSMEETFKFFHRMKA